MRAINIGDSEVTVFGPDVTEQLVFGPEADSTVSAPAAGCTVNAQLADPRRETHCRMFCDLNMI